MSVSIHGLIQRIGRVAVDVLLLSAAFFAVNILPLLEVVGSDVFRSNNSPLLHLGVYAIVSAVGLVLSKTYRMIWRYVSFGDLVTLMKAVTLVVAIFIAIEALLLNQSESVPGSLLAWTVCLLWTANLGFLALPRFVVRLISEAVINRHVRGRYSNGSQLRLLLTGDPVRMEAFIRECERDPAERYRVVGVLSDNSRFHGSYLHGIRVIDRVENLGGVLTHFTDQKTRPSTLVVARDNVSRADLAKLLELSAAGNIKLSRLPPSGIASSSTSVLPINLSDLLRRPEIQIDMNAVAQMIKGKCVFVTGAGGSIGSELSRQIAGFKPSKLVVLDFCEFNLYSIDKELEECHPDVPRATALVDVRDGALISRWVEQHKPQVVFHAAALKHVPMLEHHPIEGIKTNMVGTINVAEACVANGVSAMVTISTDKAVNPTNVMGATKRLAEAYCQGLDQTPESNSGTRFITVRFGNVLGSAGSVVPLFQHQIEAGGPVTVTHPEITRFFMTIPEAVTLVLQAGARGLADNEERGYIYLLDMGEPVKIIELARQMIRLAGARPDFDIKIKIVGLRPGEKLYEETIHMDESVLPTKSQAILKVAPRITDLRILRQQVQELKQACGIGDRDRALRLLRISVPDYAPANSRKAS